MPTPSPTTQPATSPRAGRTLHYDPAGRLAAVAMAGTVRARYRSNAFGERVLRESPETTTRFVFGPGGALLAEAGADGRVTREYVYLDGRLIAQLLPPEDPAPAPEPGVYTASGGIWNLPGSYRVRIDTTTSQLTVWRDEVVVFDGHGQRRVAFHPRTALYFGAAVDAGGRLARFMFRTAEDAAIHSPPGRTASRLVVLDPDRSRAPGGRVHLNGYGFVVQPASAGAAFAGQGRSYYVHLDPLGTPQAMTDADARLVWHAELLPFGSAVERIRDLDQRVRFPGQYQDDTAGAHYNYQRWYDPGLGRYLQSDPIGLAGGINTYAYVGGNPLRFADPLGLFVPQAINLINRYGPAMLGLARLFGGAPHSRPIAPTVSDVPAMPPWMIAGDSDGDGVPELPDDIVGENPRDSTGKRKNTDLPSDKFNDIIKGLTGGVLDEQDGQQVCPNGVRVRPGRAGQGPRIDIPGKATKPPETIHFPPDTPWPF